LAGAQALAPAWTAAFLAAASRYFQKKLRRVSEWASLVRNVFKRARWAPPERHNMSKKFLLVYRTPLSVEQNPPSPQEMEAVLTQWHAWKTKFPSIVDMGDGLLPTGKSIKGGVVTDGPTVESKELVSGYSIVAADNYDGALEVAKACPVLFAPGASIEVRELAGY
jgi:hypothetical protein